MILGICERFGKLPSEVYAEDSELLKLLSIEYLGRPPDEGGVNGE